MHTETRDERATSDLVRWRHEQLLRAGLPDGLATDLAGDARYDLHALIELTERGCPAELAVRILAPLESVGGAT